MWPPKVILHPTDFSDCSHHAFRLACQLAHECHAKLIVVHAHHPMMTAVGDVPPMVVEVENETESNRRLQMIQALNLNIKIERLMKTGGAVDVILDAAKHYHVDLVVIGTHGRKGMNRLLLGSVAENVLRRSPCPVLTTRPPWD